MTQHKNDQDWVRSQKWFHSMDLGDGLVSNGRFPHSTPPNYTLFGVFELLRHTRVTNCLAVDVGTMDGLVGFGLKARGAKKVVATDLARRDTFEFARSRLGLDIDYRVPVQALDLPKVVGEHSVDLMVMAGVLYHVIDPLAVLVACRQALRRGGLLVLESTYLYNEARATMSFNPLDNTDRGIELANVFWRASEPAICGMLQLVGFEVLACVAVDARLTILAQAKPPSQISHYSPRLKGIHEKYTRYNHYRECLNFDSLERDNSKPSTIEYGGPRGRHRLYPIVYRPVAPFQPAWRAPSSATMWRKLLSSASIHAAAETARTKERLADHLFRR